MFTSFILPLVFFSIILGALWWFGRGARGLRSLPARSDAGRPARRPAESASV